MPLIPWRPFWEIERWFEEEWPEEFFERPRWGRLFPVMRAPKMDIYETNGEVVVEVELPGIDPKNIEVEVRENHLRVEAKKEEKKEEKEKGYYRKELSRGFLRRIVPLPLEVIGEKAEAEYSNGVLKVTIPKKVVEKEKKKLIKIKTKEAKKN